MTSDLAYKIKKQWSLDAYLFALEPSANLRVPTKGDLPYPIPMNQK